MLTVSSHYLQTLRLFDRDVRLFLVSAAVVGLAWDGVRAVVLNLYLLRLGYGPEFIGVVNSAGALVFALSCLPAGAMGSRWQSRRMLVIGVILLAASFGLLPVAELFTTSGRTAWLVLTSALGHAGLALYLVNGLPFMMAATRPVERSHAFSFHMAVAPLAGFAGSLLAGILPGLVAAGAGLALESAAPYRLPLWLAALLLIPGIAVLLRTRTIDGEPSLASPATDPMPRDSRVPIGLILAIGLTMAFRFGGRGILVTFFNVYLDDGLGVSTALIGTLSAAGQLLAVPSALIAPLLVARAGNVRTVFWGTLGMAACVLPLALAPHWAPAGLGLVSSTALFSATVGPIRVFSQELVAPRWRASMASVFMMGAGLAFSSVSLLGGYAIAAVGYQTLFLIAAGLMAGGGVFFWWYFRLPRGELAGGSLRG
jgi:MFS family permease